MKVGAPLTYATLKKKGVADGYAKIDNTAPIGQPRTILENTRETVSIANLGRDGGNRGAGDGQLRGTDGTRAGQGGGAGEGLADLTPQRAADDLAAARADMAESAGLDDDVSFADLPFKMEDGTTANARDFLDDLDADAEADAVLVGLELSLLALSQGDLWT